MSGGNYWMRSGGRLPRRAVLRGAGVASAGLAAAALIGCGGGTTKATATSSAAPPKAVLATAAPSTSGPKRGGIYKTRRRNDPPTLDPNLNASSEVKSVAASVYSRLYKIDAKPDTIAFDRPPVPDLAESAESADGQNWVVKIRKGVKFQNKAPLNGREVTAEDVLASWQLLTGKTSVMASAVSNVTKVETVDNYTLKFALKGPSPVFLEMLADANLLFVVAKEAADGKIDLKTTAIGSGPWILDSYETSVRMKFSRNPDYFVKDIPYFDGLEQSVIPEYANYKAQFEAGNLHTAAIFADDVLDMRSRQPKVQWIGPSGNLLEFVGFSPEDQEPKAPWRDERFRQAVSMAVDRDTLISLMSNVAAFKKAGVTVNESWHNVIPYGLGKRWWLDPKSPEQGDSAKFFKYNPAEAKKLLQAVGVPTTPITWQYTLDYGPVFVNLATAVGNMLTEIGLKLVTEVQDYNSKWITQTFKGNFRGMTYMMETPFGEVGSYVDRDFTDNPLNHLRVKDPAIISLVQKSAVELNIDQRSALIKQIQVLNAQKMYYAPMQSSNGASWTAYRPEIQGVATTRGYGTMTEVTPYMWMQA